MIRYVLLLMSMAWLGQVFAQTDTLRLMQYNILNYRNTTAQCTNSTNNADDKDGYLQTIVEYVQPDVILVNEMGSHWLNPNKILTNALNKNGVNHFDQAEFSNNGFSSLTNMLFFNKDKLTLHNQAMIDKDLGGSNLVRVIDVYTLYMNYANALAKGDTVFMTFFVAHLKAGSTSADKTKRADMTEAAMDYLKNNYQDHNYFFAGDFNIRTHSETCYQTLTKNSATNIRFYDPKDAPGSWNNNSNYANLHTQSSHSGDTRGGCFSSGGMDDRFDFILCGKEVLDDVLGVQYISGTYKAIGQDSRRFNGDVKFPANNEVPTLVTHALYEMSDHLPVVMDVEVNDKTAGLRKNVSRKSLVINYLNDNNVEVYMPHGQQIQQVSIYDNAGKLVYSNASVNSETKINVNTTSYSGGLYIVRVLGKNGVSYTQKITIQ